MNPKLIAGLVITLAATGGGVTLAGRGMVAPAVATAAVGMALGLVLIVLGARGERASEAPPAHLKEQLARIAIPPTQAQAVPHGAPVRVGAMSPALEHARTPSGGGPAGSDAGDAVVGEGTISQAFVPDYSAQAMPGFANIYRRIAAGEMRGFVMIVGGPDRGRGLPIGDERITVGRDPSNALAVSDPGVSANQCVIWYENGQVLVGDAGSKNGTFVNNARITRQALGNCDVIAFGSTKLLVTLGA